MSDPLAQVSELETFSQLAPALTIPLSKDVETLSALRNTPDSSSTSEVLDFSSNTFTLGHVNFS